MGSFDRRTLARTTCMLPGQAASVQAEAIKGYWQRAVGEAILEMQQTRTGYQGVIVSSEKRPEIVGTVIFRNLRWDERIGTPNRIKR